MDQPCHCGAPAEIAGMCSPCKYAAHDTCECSWTPKQRGDQAVADARHRLEAWDEARQTGSPLGPTDDEGWDHVQNLLTEIDRLHTQIVVLRVSRDSYKTTYEEQS